MKRALKRAVLVAMATAGLIGGVVAADGGDDHCARLAPHVHVVAANDIDRSSVCNAIANVTEWFAEEHQWKTDITQYWWVRSPKMPSCAHYRMHYWWNRVDQAYTTLEHEICIQAPDHGELDERAYAYVIAHEFTHALQWHGGWRDAVLMAKTSWEREAEAHRYARGYIWSLR